MSKDFNNGNIYIIINNYNNDICIGSSCNSLQSRFHRHKYDAKKEYNKNLPLYKLINEIGFSRFNIELIEDYSCKNQHELNQRQGYYIRQYGTLNHNIAGRPHSEYIKTPQAKQRKKEYNNRSVICNCGCKINIGNLLKHQKSSKHISLISTNIFFN